MYLDLGNEQFYFVRKDTGSRKTTRRKKSFTKGLSSLTIDIPEGTNCAPFLSGLLL
jgi:hypothetical protein